MNSYLIQILIFHLDLSNSKFQYNCLQCLTSLHCSMYLSSKWSCLTPCIQIHHQEICITRQSLLIHYNRPTIYQTQLMTGQATLQWTHINHTKKMMRIRNDAIKICIVITHYAVIGCKEKFKLDFNLVAFTLH